MNSAGRHRRGRQAGTAGAAGSCSPLPRRRGVGRWRVTAAWTTTPSAHRGAQCSKGEEAKIATRSSGSEAEIDSLTLSLTHSPQLFLPPSSPPLPLCVLLTFYCALVAPGRFPPPSTSLSLSLPVSFSPPLLCPSLPDPCSPSRELFRISMSGRNFTKRRKRFTS